MELNINMEENLLISEIDLEKKLETNYKQGLNNAQVEERKSKYGLNKIAQRKSAHWFVIFLRALVEPILVVLMIAAVISIVAPIISNKGKTNFDDFVDAIVISIIVLLDAILETIQKIKARKSMEALKSLSRPKAIVIRNDMQTEIEASELVPGDVVVLEAGKFIPADLRIIESNELRIDESNLTGESLPVEKTHLPLQKKTKILAEMSNIAFMSTYITSGRAIGVVVKIGHETEIGKIAKTISESKETLTHLEKKLNTFTYWVSAISFVVGLLIFITLFFSGNKNAWANYLMVAITLAIGVIPECLAAIVSIVLSISTKKMVKEHVIIKNLQAVETLGNVNVICTDKTGTLTQNRMTVKKIIIDDLLYDVPNFLNHQKNEHIDLFIKALVLCNDSVTEGNERIGDPTELALVDFAELLNYDEQDARDKWERIEEIPFDSDRKMMTTINKIDNKPTIFTKGAIDQLLQKCDKIMINNQIRSINQDDKENLLKKAEQLSDQALRVLAFAYSQEYEETNKKMEHEKNLIFLGAVAMIDPVRDSAVKAVRLAHDAGIQVAMITGDHALTALAIAKELYLADNINQVLTGNQLNSMSDQQIYEIIENIKVFARVNPEHKVKIVEALQKHNNITSMTGDGVNDAPSLSIADIGVAMGMTGTDVAKQAADIILTNDNFETIIRGVNEGRNVYQKIKRAIAFVLGVNIANVFAIFILSSINKVSPVEATNILWMNLIVESIIALSIGMGKNDDSLMKIKPIKGKNSLFKGLFYTFFKIILFTTITLVGSYYFGMSLVNRDEIQKILGIEQALKYNSWFEIFQSKEVSIIDKIEIGNFGRTAFFTVITCAPCFYVNFIKLSNWKTTSKIQIVVNKPLWIASVLSIFLSLIAIFLPGFNSKVLNLVPTSHYNNHNWYLVLTSFAIALLPCICMLALDGIIFGTYHKIFKKIKNKNQDYNSSIVNIKK